MTDRLYYSEPYRTEFDATVRSADPAEGGTALVLDRTCFYPGGGGQPADRGAIDGIPVVGVRALDDGRILHLLERPPKAGTATVHGTVDRPWRLDFMEQHTGQHLLSASLLAAAGLPTVSVHFGEATTTVELGADRADDAALGRAEELANAIVKENRRVTTRVLPRAEALQLPLRRTPPEEDPLRIVEIEGFDTAACGGVHVATTGEIFLVKIAAVERIRGRVRVHAVMGRRAFADYGRALALAQALSKALTCGEGDILRRVEELAARERELARELRRIRAAEAAGFAEEAVSAGVEVTAGTTGVLFVSHGFSDVGEDAVNAFVDRVLAGAGRVVAVADRTADGFRWTVAHSAGPGLDLRGPVARLLSAMGLRGGGKPALMKGSGRDPAVAPAFLEAVRKALAP